MAEPELKHDLTPEEERLAESYFCRKWGELPATEEMDLNAAVCPGLHEELDAVDAAVKAAYAVVPQSAGFVDRVMKSLSAEVRPSSKPETVLSVQAVSERRSGRLWVWGAVGAVAALLFLVACLWLPALRISLGTPTAQVAVGRVLDASGQEVKELMAGQTYQVAGTAAVVRMGQDASVRLLQESRFEVPEDQTAGLRLHEGWAYAQSPKLSEVRVESEELTADVQGLSLVVQAASRSVEPGEGMVLVFVGSARVRPPMGDGELVLKEGQMFTVGLGTHVVESFLEEAPETVHELEHLPADSTQVRVWRKQYLEVVAGYRRELSSFSKELSTTQDADRRAELKRRQAQVQEYLKQHQRRLQTLPELSDNETPEQRVKRVQRAVKRIERGQKEFSDPNQWL